MVHKKKSRGIDEYNEQYYKDRGLVMQDCHWTNILDHLLRRYHAKRILDVGCGSGKLMRLLNKWGYTYVKGIDISPVAVKLSGGKLASATKIPFADKTFDCVIGMSVIEHLHKKEGDTFLREAYRVLRSGGFIFMLTPNGSSPWRLIQGEKWYGYGDPTHVFFYSPGSLKDSLIRNGFRKIRRTFKITIDTFDWPIPMFGTLPRPLLRFLNFLWVSTPLAFVRDSIFISGVKPG